MWLHLEGEIWCPWRLKTLTPVAETGNTCFQDTAESQHRNTKPLQRPRFHILSACVFFNFVHARTSAQTHTSARSKSARSFEAGDKINPGLAHVKFGTDGTKLGFCAQMNVPTKTHRSWSTRHCRGQVSWWCPEPCSQACHGRLFLAAYGAPLYRCTHCCPDLAWTERAKCQKIVCTSRKEQS